MTISRPIGQAGLDQLVIPFYPNLSKLHYEHNQPSIFAAKKIIFKKENICRGAYLLRINLYIFAPN